jgi:hypothetical protein
VVPVLLLAAAVFLDDYMLDGLRLDRRGASALLLPTPLKSLPTAPVLPPSASPIAAPPAPPARRRRLFSQCCHLRRRSKPPRRGLQRLLSFPLGYAWRLVLATHDNLNVFKKLLKGSQN